MAKGFSPASWAVLFAALVILSSFKTEGAPTKSLKILPRLIEGLEKLQQKLHKRNLLSKLSCDACKAGVGILDRLYSQHEDKFVSAVTTFCIDYKIEDRNVCKLVVQEFKVSSRRGCVWPLYCHVDICVKNQASSKLRVASRLPRRLKLRRYSDLPSWRRRYIARSNHVITSTSRLSLAVCISCMYEDYR